jgi:hypothetical protein
MGNLSGFEIVLLGAPVVLLAGTAYLKRRSFLWVLLGLIPVAFVGFIAWIVLLCLPRLPAPAIQEDRAHADNMKTD